MAPVGLIASPNLSIIHFRSATKSFLPIFSLTPTESNCMFIRETVSSILSLSPITKGMSTNLIPTLSIRSLYAGPIPLPVVPTTLSALSYILWKGSITDALSLMNSLFPSGLSFVRLCHLSSSSSKTHGSTTMPSPRTKLQWVDVTPEGIW